LTKKVARVVPAKPTELDQHRQVRIPSCDWSRWRTTLALMAAIGRRSVSNAWRRHVTPPGVVILLADPFESVRVDYAAALAATCMRVFKLAKSASGTSFAVFAAVSAAFS
jgi:hypothetical protein